jgi:hypothetical protein
MSGREFLSGLDLSEAFFTEAVAPLLETELPQLRYSCGLIGSGSEVLGFDDQMSSDHHWGPRALLFLSDADRGQIGPRITEFLACSLPREFRGYPTNFTDPDPNDSGTQMLEAKESGPINHRVEVWTIRDFFREYTGFDVRETLRPRHWLAIPQHKLRTITGGRVFRDDLDLNKTRARFAYYPQDVWLYLLAAGWMRIEQEEHFVGRSGYVGDELGSAVIGARLVRDIMRLCFLMEKQYIPYPKWFGTAFKFLPSAAKLTPLLEAVFTSSSWKERQSYLSLAYQVLAGMLNSCAVTEPLPVTVEPFFVRPFFVISKGRFSAAIKKKIEDPEVKALASKRLIGSVDLFSDSTDILSDSCWFPNVVQFYR